MNELGDDPTVEGVCPFCSTVVTSQRMFGGVLYIVDKWQWNCSFCKAAWIMRHYDTGRVKVSVFPDTGKT
jgi:hypothetical protein